jgi:gamma-glutamylcyclotransferase (GGCT)/AIG2-like uncharacterized protein YtfP
MSETCKVFVYGTLKVGGYFAINFDMFRVNSKKAKAKGCMFSLNGIYPTVDFSDEGEIIGEVHEYTDPKTVISMLDRIEGFKSDNYHGNLYNRIKINVVDEDNKVEEDVFAYTYNGSTKDLPVVKTGEWLNYK